MAQLIGTSGNDNLVGTSAADTIDALAGNDTLVGLAGNDRLIGGAGDDRYVVATGDILSDTGGIDTVESSTTWSLGTAFENLVLTGTGVTSGSGNELANVITGSAGHNWLRGRGGNDTLFGGGGNDTFNMSLGAGGLYGSDTVDGGTGTDTLDFGAAALTAVVIDLGAGTATGGGSGGAGSVSLTNVENANGGAFNDLMLGSSAANFLFGYNGDDTLDGMAGNDRLEGGSGNDQYLFSAAPDAANADTVIGFVSGSDKIVLDGRVHLNLGANGNFVMSDARFSAGMGYTSGRDVDDRVVYNTTSGQLFYDADGSGSGAARLIATFGGAPMVRASDIAVQNSAAEPIHGTATNDSLIGTVGNDSIYAFEGDDTVQGAAGNDTLDGGPGNDSLVAGAGDDFLLGDEGADFLSAGDGNDTIDAGSNSTDPFGEPTGDWDDTGSTWTPFPGDSIDGGLGNDLYKVQFNDVVSDLGGHDHIITDAWEYRLPSGIEDLSFDTFGWSDGEGMFTELTGNELDNVITVDWFWWSSGQTLDGGDGNDTLIGSGDAFFKFSAGSGNYGNDVLRGGDTGTLVFADARSAIVADLAAGTVKGGGTGGSGSATFTNVGNVIGGAFDDRIRADPSAWYGGYNEGDPYIRAGAGNDTIEGVADADPYEFNGGAGNDRIITRTGADAMTGGTGVDQFVFAVAPGNSALPFDSPDITDFESGVDKIVLDGTFMTALGGSGTFAVSDARFYAASGATSGADTDDRIVYNTSTNELFYDADGSGSTAAQLIGRLQPNAAVAATDIVVENGGTSPPPPPPPSGGQSISGTAAAETLTGGAGSDTISGLAGSDRLFGRDGNDSLRGGTEADNMFGENGDDWLDGDAGQDRVTGGAGADSFVYNDPLATGNTDYINDFVSGTDKILLDNAVMTALGPDGMLASGRFVAAPNARPGLDSDDRLMYDTVTGKLYYDADGSGAGPQSVIALLTGAPTLVASDIVVI